MKTGLPPSPFSGTATPDLQKTTMDTRTSYVQHEENMRVMEEETYKVADSVYAPSKIIGLKSIVGAPPNREQATLQVKVRQHQRPWTLSCGMIVEMSETSGASANLGSLGSSGEAFLKMYDRRFAVQFRQDEAVDTWFEDIEQQLLRDLSNGKVEEFLDMLKTKPGLKRDTMEYWNYAQEEADLAQMMRRMFDSETATYARLQKYQGKIIPRLLCSVALDTPVPDRPLTPYQQDFYQHRGILLEYLHGFTLSKMVENVPQSAWQGIFDQAVQIVHILGDNNILNKDVRPDNFMIVPEGDNYKVFMIDFGQCRPRREDESDEDWGRAKSIQDEEGAIAMVMRQWLKSAGFELQYMPSGRYDEWADDSDEAGAYDEVSYTPHGAELSEEAQEILGAAASAFIHRLVETKGLDDLDPESALRNANQKLEEKLEEKLSEEY
ncbi:hypothetical protein ACHAPU_006316 [Fusarium lateritium]